MQAAAMPLRCLSLLVCCLLLLAWPPLTVRGQTKSSFLKVAVEDAEVYAYLVSKSSSTTLLASFFPEAYTTKMRMNFTHVPIRGAMENVSFSDQVQANLVKLGVSAMVSDYYISVAIATYSMDIPYFIIRKNVFSYSKPGTPNTFEIEINNFHLSQALYDVSVVYKITNLIVVSDGTPSSSQFLVNFGGRVFSVYTVLSSSNDSKIYSVFTRHNPNTMSSGMAWILLFDEPNLPLMERTLVQASRAGIFVPSQFFYVPSLFDKQSYLTRFYRSDIEIYTFLMTDRKRYTRYELLYPFVLDSLNHFVKAYIRWTARPLNWTLSNAIANEPSISRPLTGPFTYDPVLRVRSKVQLDVVRSNRSLGADYIFSLAGKWQNDGSGNPPYTPEYGLAEDVSRSRIVFAAIESEPYFYDYNSATGLARGLSLEIVEAMRLQLGFEYKVIRANSQKEVIDLLKNKSADVSLNFLAPTFDRLEFTDLSVDMVQDGIQMLNSKVVHTTDFLHVFQPFSFYVWMSIVLAIVILSATLYLCDKISPNTQDKPMFTPFESFFLVLSSFLMSKVETEPKKFSSRLFTLLLWFSTLLYMTTYLSNLVAFLIKPDEQTVFATVGDLEPTKGYKWGYVKDSLVDDEVKTNWPRVHARAQREWPEEMYINSIEEAIAKVLRDPKFILIASADTLSFMKNKDCKLRVMGNIANSHYLTWLFRKGFPFKNNLNDQLKTRKDTDFAQLRSKYFDLNRCYSGQTDIENKVQLGFEYLYGLFVLLGVGIVLGFAQLFVRWIFHRLREQWRSRRQKLHFKRGHVYQAEVYDARSNGVWIRVEKDTEVHFLDNSSLYPNAEESVRHSNSKLKGQYIPVLYVGRCRISGARILVKHSVNSVSTIENVYSETCTANEDSA